MASHKTGKKKVMVGMSGGVDSSVSAALLKNAGFNVTGVFIKVWQPDWIDCTWRDDRRDAMRVAAQLGIPFVTLDLEKEYKKGVIDYMIEEYRNGRTPNPDVMCNREVKFGAFYKWAKSKGADYVATGHYAQIKEVKGKKYLYAGKDQNKDQSYFLWTLTQEELDHILFPIGHLKKDNVRKLAKEFNLYTAEKKDSQGLCFIGKLDIKDFLSSYIKPVPGKVLDKTGNVIGKHDGAWFLTIGERHGFTIEKKTPHDRPYYIIAKNIENNTVTVSQKEKGFVKTNVHEAHISKINIYDKEKYVNKIIKARSRYRQTLYDAKVVSYEADGKCKIQFVNSENTFCSGQSVVFYDGGKCIGGGILV